MAPAACFLALAAGGPALAQVETPVPPPDETAPAQPEGEERADVEVFERSFFDVYNPVTARDMVQRVPGFSVQGGGGGGGGGGGFGNFGGGQRRGFGQNASNVLINGERPSTKTSINDTLGRISADNVARIELLRGAALSDVDVRGQTQIANVILLPGASIGAVTTYIAEISTNEVGQVGYDLQATRTFRAHDADVTLDVRVPRNLESGDQIETLTSSAGDTIELRDEGDTRENRQIGLNATVAWAPTDRDSFTANVDFTPKDSRQDAFSFVVDGDGDPVRTEFTTNEESDSYESEIGGDWERQLTASTSFKLLGLVTQRSQANEQREDTYFPDASEAASLLMSDSTAGERILRGTFTWRASGAHTLEAGLEGAFNFRDSDLDLLFADAVDGPFASIFTDEVRVEELRGEVYVTDVWNVRPNLTVESGFTFEASRISQFRPGGDPFEREFTYPKPNLTATYSLPWGDQLRLSVVRDVAQLDFGDFASSVNLSDDRQEAGNRELQPEQAWQTRLQWERRFAARGVVTVEAFYDAVEDKQDRVPVPVTIYDAEGDPIPIDLDDPSTYAVVDGAGNLGDGTRVGVRVDTTLPLDFLGIPNGELRMRGRRQETEVEDPVTGATRSFSGNNDWDYNINFRQDVPGRELAWGVEYNRDALRQVYRVTETQEFGPGSGFLQLYAETTRFMGVTLRLQVNNAADSTFVRRRYFYIDPDTGLARPRDLGPPDAVEERQRQMGPFYSLRVSGTF